MGWLRSLLYGLVAGLTEFLPVSSQAHRALLQQMLGMEGEVPLQSLAIHIGILAALLLSCKSVLHRLQRERKLTRVPKRRRRRQPDARTLLDVRLVKTAALPMVLGLLFAGKTAKWSSSLPLLAGFLLLNGLLLFLPHVLPYGNKDSRSMSRFDGWVIGIGGALSVLPGVSRVGATTSLAVSRGADRQNALHWALLLSIPALCMLIGFDIFRLITPGLGAVAFGTAARYIFSGVSAFCGAYLSIFIMRNLSVNLGFTGFSYYSWGAALFAFILYLTV